MAAVLHPRVINGRRFLLHLIHSFDTQTCWTERSLALGPHVSLYIHPQIPQRPVRDTPYGGFGEPVSTAFAAFGLGWHYEAGVQFVQLMHAGVLDKFQDYRLF